MIEILTRAGTYHDRTHTENQDAVSWSRRGSLAGLFLADGVSSCAEAGTGARLCCAQMENLLMKKGLCFLGLEPREAAGFILEQVRHTLRERAAQAGNPVEHYSSTMACALLDSDSGRLLTVNLGDGLIAGLQNGALKILEAPDDSAGGCCCTTTLGAEKRMAAHLWDARELDQVFLCSDGAWRALFDGAQLRPELRRGDCAALAAYLQSTEIFDDCSFISMDIKQDGGRTDE